jgi:hypothetical protein
MSTTAEGSTWKPIHSATEHSRLDASYVSSLPDSAFAFPNSRKEPITDASHVRNALARFNQVEHVTDAERDVAFANIKKAAAYYNIELRETDWRQLRGHR